MTAGVEAIPSEASEDKLLQTRKRCVEGRMHGSISAHVLPENRFLDLEKNLVVSKITMVSDPFSRSSC